MKRIGILLTGASALVLSGCDLAESNASPTPVWARGPVIEAQGRAYVEMPANRSQFSVSFEGRDADSAEASRIAVERANLATEAVRLATEGQVRVTANLSVQPYYQQVTQQISEFQERLIENRHPDALLGYVATVQMHVVVLDPAVTSQARGAALAAGPVNSGNVDFFLEPTVENQRAAFAAAVEDATQRAQIVADAAGDTLGVIVTLQEGSGPCLGRPSTDTGFDDAYDEYARLAAPPSPPPPPPPPPPPSPGGDGRSAQDLLDAAGGLALAADQEPQRVTANVCAIFAVED